ncbi:MAG: bifunctional diaminohydroxyphosphoribosylaminopyrimidine deaminase/5-amino-6-(5-phosphoribosylamino)uracil reductase RibD [Rhizobiales bacterium]|nr:bifunctional diaminohydroxyphosphoribosylaminopyrimidine deaminase/5-amino-6-(5-phosphoribosylamino)uracil reductase RibD [Hyphomicrobiales bacterium]MBI3672962.1 bifunctional diaminohydroxyphosphoribosylaminopyrimidine deaminase/5-amino-6-(5-phosphoribosylamino)uracil reductase RibD [Hyphomicrobiales bacterium]
MDVALRLGRRALGTTAENPPVGCVIVKDDRLLAVGWTQAGGRPHAETEALAMAGEAARGATAFVTLEPCAHYGRTPPCAEALVAAGIARCVVAVEDPDPRVAGRGLAILRAAGITVELADGATEARRDLAGFLTRIVRKRPYVILKLALSADGKIASEPGQRTPITGEAVRARVHLTRAQSDAILVGMETVVVDDPELTCRLPGLEARSPKAFVMSRNRELPAGSRLAARGAKLLRGTPAEAVAELGVAGINRLMVEGGAAIARAFLQAGLVDEIHLYRSPTELGPQGVEGLPEGALQTFMLQREERLGADTLTVYEKPNSFVTPAEAGAHDSHGFRLSPE